MHEILIYFFIPCLPNVLVTKEPTVRAFWLSCTWKHTWGFGKTDTFVWALFHMDSLGRGSCVKWAELCSVAISRDQEQKGLISQLVLMSSPFYTGEGVGGEGRAFFLRQSRSDKKQTELGL